MIMVKADAARCGGFDEDEWIVELTPRVCWKDSISMESMSYNRRHPFRT